MRHLQRARGSKGHDHQSERRRDKTDANNRAVVLARATPKNSVFPVKKADLCSRDGNGFCVVDDAGRIVGKQKALANEVVGRCGDYGDVTGIVAITLVQR